MAAGTFALHGGWQISGYKWEMNLDTLSIDPCYYIIHIVIIVANTNIVLVNEKITKRIIDDVILPLGTSNVDED